MIYVESGRGLVQKWGGEVQEMSAGDIIYTAAGEKHWHGAAPDSRLTIVATSLGETEWLEPVQPAGGKQPGRVPDSGHGHRAMSGVWLSFAALTLLAGVLIVRARHSRGQNIVLPFAVS